MDVLIAYAFLNNIVCTIFDSIFCHQDKIELKIRHHLVICLDLIIFSYKNIGDFSYWLTSHVFWSYHQVFELPCNQRATAPLSRLWWFWLCWWFEANVPDG